MRQKKALNGYHLEVFLALQCSTEHDFDLSTSNLFLTFVRLLQEIKKKQKRGYAFKFQIHVMTDNIMSDSHLGENIN